MSHGCIAATATMQVDYLHLLAAAGSEPQRCSAENATNVTFTDDIGIWKLKLDLFQQAI